MSLSTIRFLEGFGSAYLLSGLIAAVVVLLIRARIPTKNEAAELLRKDT